MSKRKYDQYGENQLAFKHSQSKHFSNYHKISSDEHRQENMDSNHGQESKENANQKSNALCRVDRRLGNDGNGGRSNKMNKLLEALDDFLISEPEDFGLSFGASDQDILSQCKALRKTLRKQRNSLSPRSTLPTIDTTAPRTNHNAHEEQDLPYVPPPLSLTPWTSGSVPKTLPALPEIKSLTLETATFTHSGVTSNAGAFSYERLEWLGDAYLYLVSTILISSTFTSHLPGKCAQIRELLVKNETLASYARHYGFEKRARLPSEFSSDNLKGYRAKEVEKVKVMGDIFEAYVAAVILSDPEQGVDRVSAWLKSLWAQTISKQIKDQERLNEKTKAIPVDNVNANLNPKDMLSRKIGAKGVKITYRDIGPEKKDPVTGFPLFTVGVYLDGWGEHDKQLGVGKALGKKDAGMKAADMALANKKLMAKYGEMKRVHDEKLQAEKERQAAEGDHSSQATGAGCHL